MTGETNLDVLLASMTPVLADGEYVFCNFPDARYGDRPELAPVASCLEPEGLTLVVPKSRADEYDQQYDSVFRRISLGVHSSLEAVGLTAALATRLTEHGISANVIAGYFHDHIFVRNDHADRAMAALADYAR